MDNFDELDLKIETTKAALRKLTSKKCSIESKIKYPKYKKLEGTVWRVKNNYSCPKKPSDYWWLYCKVLKIHKNGEVDLIRFQMDHKGMLMVEPNKDFWEPYFFADEGRGWEKVPYAMWERVIDKSLTKLFKAGLE